MKKVFMDKLLILLLAVIVLGCVHEIRTNKAKISNLEQTLSKLDTKVDYASSNIQSDLDEINRRMDVIGE